MDCRQAKHEHARKTDKNSNKKVLNYLFSSRNVLFFINEKNIYANQSDEKKGKNIGS